MTITIKTARTLLLTVGLALPLALGACGQGDSDNKSATKDVKGKEADAKGAAVKAGDKGEVVADADADADADQPLDERVIKAAGLAKKIEADPTRADDILAEAGLDRARFDALIYEVSTPELAEQYRLARARD
jgi:hypothetical protein